ncbi:MAG: DNA repair protein RecN [Sphingomonadales bacterium]|nr:MAG: DNA repair protein RecN [Sphingomonadales bacterium]
MLTRLTIRDIVLIEALTVEFAPGLCVLTGETGAGKSILLDALGLTLGDRADAGLVRAGVAQGSASASFEVPPGHAARALLRDSGLDDQDELIIRRVVKADGGSRAFVNDQPVSAALLRDLGGLLVEVHGQHDERGLLNPRGHRTLLDRFARLDTAEVARLHRDWALATQALVDAEAALAADARDREWLDHAVDELTRLKPLPGEETALADARQAMLKGERLAGDLALVTEHLSDTAHGGLPALRQAARRLERLAAEAPDLAAALQALDAAIDAGTRAEDMVQAVVRTLTYDPATLEATEARLFDLRGMARKHKVAVDDLAALADQLAARRAALTEGEAGLAALARARDAARMAFEAAAAALSQARQAAAGALDRAVMAELAPLKLEAARFATVVETLPPAQWGAEGADRVEFTIATNPGASAGPLIKVASGGELFRFILALKVALAAEGAATTLIFDEIDRGVGGAVAAAIGERLARLGQSAQVLVVTHSPQVAARGNAQWRITKTTEAESVRTSVAALDAVARREEIARMLSGDAVTPEARAQAERLLEGAL